MLRKHLKKCKKLLVWNLSRSYNVTLTTTQNMEINQEELYKLYMAKVEEICEEIDWKTNFSSEEIVNLIVHILENNPHLIEL